MMDVELDQFVMDDTNNIYDSEDVAAFEATLDPTLVREVRKRMFDALEGKDPDAAQYAV